MYSHCRHTSESQALLAAVRSSHLLVSKIKTVPPYRIYENFRKGRITILLDMLFVTQVLIKPPLLGLLLPAPYSSFLFHPRPLPSGRANTVVKRIACQNDVACQYYVGVPWKFGIRPSCIHIVGRLGRMLRVVIRMDHIRLHERNHSLSKGVLSSDVTTSKEVERDKKNEQ